MERYIHKVRYYESDAMGITHHSNYIRFMEEARIDALDRAGYGFEKMEADGVSSPVVSLRVNYRRPTKFQDEISIELKALDLDSVKVRFAYKMYVGDTLVCTAESTHAFYKNGRPLPLSQLYPELCEKLAAEQ